MAPPGNMFFVEHLYELRTRLLRIVVITVSTIIFCTVFGVQLITIDNFSFYFFFPSVYESISGQVTLLLSKNLLPPGVQLIQTAPGQSLFAQVYVSVLIGVTVSIPVIVREIFGFINPAISSNSKNIALIRFVIPVAVLFLAGILFSFFFAIPLILTFLYQYGQYLGILSFLNINEFVSFVLQFFIAFGICFQLPLVMLALSMTELIERRFWIVNLRYAVLLMVIFGAIITPDGSGITMWIISIPMIGLYFLGILLIGVLERGKNKQKVL